MAKGKYHERRQRQIDQLKQDILKAARQLALKNGWPSVSIRKISDIIEYTPPVIYEHFENKEAILAELESMGFRKLRHAMEDARQQAKTPEKQLEEVAKAYWEFATQHPELYQVMYNLQGIQSKPPDTRAIRNTGQPVLETLRYLHTFPAERESLFFQWWALSHGFVSLYMSGQLPSMKDGLKQNYLDAVRRFAKGMG